MAKSERAKELAAKQKAEAKALREAKRKSDNPADWGTLRQIWESFKLARQYDKSLPWLIGGVWLGSIVLMTVLAVQFSSSKFSWIWGLLTGILLGATFALLILTRRTKKATYQRYRGQPGAGEVALSMLNKKKWSYSSAIAFTRQMDTIHRVLGPAGVILICDGNPHRLKQQMTTQLRRHQQVLYGIEVHQVQIGDEEGQVPLEELTKYIEKLPRTLDKVQIEETRSRLRALDAMNQKVPLPKGPMPTSAKGARKMMRGR